MGLAGKSSRPALDAVHCFHRPNAPLLFLIVVYSAKQCWGVPLPEPSFQGPLGQQAQATEKEAEFLEMCYKEI